MPKPIGPHHRPLHPSSAAVSMLGADTSIRGDIRADADLHVEGCVDGDISCTALHQGEASTITGGISAQSARVAGKVEGAIVARELVILKTARIRGDVTYDSLTIENGAQIDGRVTPRSATATPPVQQFASAAQPRLPSTKEATTGDADASAPGQNDTQTDPKGPESAVRGSEPRLVLALPEKS